MLTARLYSIRWETPLDEPLPDGKPSAAAAPTWRTLQAAVADIGRRFPPGTFQWVKQAIPGDSLIMFSIQSQVRITLEVIKL